MRNFVYYFSILCLLFVTGCLQEAADIDGVKNYYLPPESKISVNRDGYSDLKTKKSDGSYVFEDEIGNAPDQKKNVIDPYANDPSSNDGVNFNVDSNSTSNPEQNKNVDWDNIFADNKKNPDSTTTESKNNDNLQDQKKEINNQPSAAKKEINTSKNQTNQKQGSEIPIIKRTPKVDEKPKDINKKEDKKNVTEKKDIKKTPVRSDVCCIKRPTQGAVLSKYGKSGDNELDDGMTFKVTDKNIVSAGDGKVIYVDGEGSSRKTVIVKHNNGLIVSYSYNGDVKTALNREVKAGQSIGNVSADKNVLYFTVRNKGKTIDPESIIK